VAGTGLGRRTKVQMIEAILERECAMRNILQELQHEDSLVDAALQALGQRVASTYAQKGWSAIREHV
jgi:hypothetical protein